MLILTLFLREYTLERRTVRGGEPNTTGDLERGGVESVRDDGGERRRSRSLDENAVAEPELLEEARTSTG